MNGPLKNDVEIDQAALAAEAASIPLPDPAPAGDQVAGDQVAPGADASGEPSPDQVRAMAEGAEPVIGAVLEGLFETLAPNWKVAPEKAERLTKATSLALVYWFPHEIPPKYMALVMVAGALGGIAKDNKDPVTGAYKPLQVPPKKADDAAGAAE